MQCGFKDGSDRLHLRLPEEVTHRIVPASPLASWLQAGGGGLSQDADTEIFVVVSTAAPAAAAGCICSHASCVPRPA